MLRRFALVGVFARPVDMVSAPLRLEDGTLDPATIPLPETMRADAGALEALQFVLQKMAFVNGISVFVGQVRSLPHIPSYSGTLIVLLSLKLVLMSTKLLDETWTYVRRAREGEDILAMLDSATVQDMQRKLYCLLDAGTAKEIISAVEHGARVLSEQHGRMMSAEHVRSRFLV